MGDEIWQQPEGKVDAFVQLWDPSVVSEIATVSTEEAQEMARRLAREEAVFAGTSTGANSILCPKE